jgi:predicted ester cyclase
MKDTKELAKLIVGHGLEGCDRQFIYKHFQHDSMIKNMIAYYRHTQMVEIDENTIPDLMFEVNQVLAEIIGYV